MSTPDGVEGEAQRQSVAHDINAPITVSYTRPPGSTEP